MNTYTCSENNVLQYNSINGYDQQHYYFSGFNDEQNDCSDASTSLKVINDMLMEDEDEYENENTPYMFHDFSALQATERSFYDALNNNNNGPEPFDTYDHNSMRSSYNANHLGMQACNKKAAITAAAKAESVDLRSLLMTCAQAVSSHDTTNANHLLLQIRQHSSPQGDSLKRVAHYVANALEARLAGTGTRLCSENYLDRIPTDRVLRSYKTYTSACPFFKMSYYLANKTIEKFANGATTLHVIDFGIMYGLQWPGLIKALSERPGGPPMLRITGIELPQKRVDVLETGQRLAKQCERYGVQFEYNGIAQVWESVKLRDLKIGRYEVVVVNCLNRLHNLFDETVIAYNPREAVLSLIRSISPAVFVHGVASGQYSAPFFTTRFKEALFTFSNMFDMLEATISYEGESRRLFEEVFGNVLMNVVACEGTERVERPEMYKQWQMRMKKAGFTLLPLDQKIVRHIRSTVKRKYHKDFYVDEDGKWMLQGWKGRVNEAISCWQPLYSYTL